MRSGSFKIYTIHTNHTSGEFAFPSEVQLSLGALRQSMGKGNGETFLILLDFDIGCLLSLFRLEGFGVNGDI